MGKDRRPFRDQVFHKRPAYVKTGKKPGQHGEKHWRAKLTDDQVRAIKHLYVYTRASARVIALQFGVGRSSISKIISGSTWKHIEVD